MRNWARNTGMVLAFGGLLAGCGAGTSTQPEELVQSLAVESFSQTSPASAASPSSSQEELLVQETRAIVLPVTLSRTPGGVTTESLQLQCVSAKSTLGTQRQQMESGGISLIFHMNASDFPEFGLAGSKEAGGAWSTRIHISPPAILPVDLTRLLQSGRDVDIVALVPDVDAWEVAWEEDPVTSATHIAAIQVRDEDGVLYHLGADTPCMPYPDPTDSTHVQVVHPSPEDGGIFTWECGDLAIAPLGLLETNGFFPVAGRGRAFWQVGGTQYLISQDYGSSWGIRGASRPEDYAFRNWYWYSAFRFSVFDGESADQVSMIVNGQHIEEYPVAVGIWNPQTGVVAGSCLSEILALIS